MRSTKVQYSLLLNTSIIVPPIEHPFETQGFRRAKRGRLPVAIWPAKQSTSSHPLGSDSKSSGSDYLVEVLNLDHLPIHFITPQIRIIDFGESYLTNIPPPGLGITVSFRSPELLFDNNSGIGCDLLARTSTLFEIPTRSPLFENFMVDETR